MAFPASANPGVSSTQFVLIFRDLAAIKVSFVATQLQLMLGR